MLRIESDSWIDPGELRRASLRWLLALGPGVLLACGEVTPDPPRDAAPSSSAPRIEQATASSGSVEAARAVLFDYYDAVAGQEYERAYLLWADSGRASGQTLEEFEAGFQSTTSVRASIGEPGPIEGAAGSRYIEFPVRIEAQADTSQSFAGSYVLRRSVVDGATEEQTRWRIYSADIRACSSVACPPVDRLPADVSRVIDRFGERLRRVSVLAPVDTAVGAIRQQYSALVTPELLSRMVENPTQAPGRETSNPWPREIAVTDAILEADGSWAITAEVRYVASADSTNVIELRPFALRVVHRDDLGWRIADVEYQAPP